jgi:hypothetical protein
MDHTDQAITDVAMCTRIYTGMFNGIAREALAGIRSCAKKQILFKCEGFFVVLWLEFQMFEVMHYFSSSETIKWSIEPLEFHELSNDH